MVIPSGRQREESNKPFPEMILLKSDLVLGNYYYGNNPLKHTIIKKSSCKRGMVDSRVTCCDVTNRIRFFFIIISELLTRTLY